MRIERFIVPLTAEVAIRVRMSKVGGRLAGFAVQLERIQDDGVQAIMRYDTAHGRLHVHNFWKEKESQMTFLEEDGSHDYFPQLDEALTDLEENYGSYLRKMAP